MGGVIKFGTDGWRGIIGEEFTFANLAVVARRSAAWAKKRGGGVCIGYDNRFLSEVYADFAAGVIEQEGVKVDLSLYPVPTPCVSYRVKNTGAALGAVITASHNAPEYNGYKIKEKYGGSASPQTCNEITRGLEKTPPLKGDFSFGGKKNNWTKPYTDRIKKILPEGDSLAASDFMYGSAAPCFEGILSDKGYRHISLHNYRDPLFGGRSPEPIPSNLNFLSEAVKKNKADIGFAFDGDGDRIAVVDERARYISPQAILSLLAHDLLSRGKKGRIVLTVAGTYLVSRIADCYGAKLKTVPIGFKNICPHLIKGDVLVAGEESGGIGFGDYLPERDALYTAARLLELSSRKNKKIGVLWDNLREKYGNSVYLRKDIDAMPGMDVNLFVGRLKDEISSGLLPFKVKKMLDIDGLRITFENDRWLLLRPSGTEPVIRIYAEAENSEKVSELIDEGAKACRFVTGKISKK